MVLDPYHSLQIFRSSGMEPLFSQHIFCFFDKPAVCISARVIYSPVIRIRFVLSGTYAESLAQESAESNFTVARPQIIITHEYNFSLHK